MTKQTLSFIQPVVIEAIDGATLPNPGAVGVTVWSTAGYLMSWNGISWARTGGTPPPGPSGDSNFDGGDAASIPVVGLTIDGGSA